MLKIEKNKILYFPHKESKTYRNLSKIKGAIFRKMNDVVEISADVTFGDFFKFLIKEKELTNLIFGASLYGVPFDLLIKDFKKKNKQIDADVHFLEIYWYVDYDEDGLLIETDFHGIGKWNSNDDPNYIGAIGLDFTQINELKDYQLKLNENLEIRNNNLKSENLILKTTKQFTLFEIIHAVLYEITWYGTPEMRDKKGKNILKEVENIKKKKRKTFNSVQEMIDNLNNKTKF